LLFADGALAALSSDIKRRHYVVAIADDIQYNAAQLVAEWSLTENYGQRFVNADGELSSVRSSISMLANEMIAELEDVGSFWIGGSLGYRDGGVAQPHLVEAPYSRTSAAKLIANIEGFQMAFNGLGDAPSLADYLDFIGAAYEGQPMSVAVNEQAERTISALLALETPLTIAVVEHRNEAETAYFEARLLLQMVKVDMASQLGITVTFNDNDGD
jgi:predicted lipoprotein